MGAGHLKKKTGEQLFTSLNLKRVHFNIGAIPLAKPVASDRSWEPGRGLHQQAEGASGGLPSSMGGPLQYIGRKKAQESARCGARGRERKCVRTNGLTRDFE